MVNKGDYWEANIDGQLRLVQIQGIYKHSTRPRTAEEKQKYIASFGDEYYDNELDIYEDSRWLYGDWEEGLEDVLKDPNARLRVYFEDGEEDWIYPSQLLSRVPAPPAYVEDFAPPDPPEPESDEEGPTQEEVENPETVVESNKVVWGVGIGALVLFWDEILLIFLATR